MLDTIRTLFKYENRHILLFACFLFVIFAKDDEKTNENQ